MHKNSRIYIIISLVVISFIAIIVMLLVYVIANSIKNKDDNMDD